MTGQPRIGWDWPHIAVHIDSGNGVLTDEQVAAIVADADNPMNYCCIGAAMYGPDRCTCWIAVYSTRRRKPLGGEMTARVKPCDDCAYRHDSAEYQDEDGRQHLESLANGTGVFVCHQGMPHVVRWRHPSGMVVEATRDEVGAIHTWAPRYVDGTPFKAMGGALSHWRPWPREGPPPHLALPRMWRRAMRLVGSTRLPCGHQRAAKLDSSNRVRRCRTCRRVFAFTFVPALYQRDRCGIADAVRLEFTEVPR